MRETNWLELSENTPSTMASCTQYFQERYMNNWKSKGNELDRLLEFLATGVGVRIWGFDNHWGYEIYENARRVKIIRGISSREEVNTAAIKAAFIKSEQNHYH